MPSDEKANISLLDLQKDESAVLLEIISGIGLASRLTTLGFTPGVEIRMDHNYGHGPLIVTVRDSQVALGRGEARKIIVQRKDS